MVGEAQESEEARQIRRASSTWIHWHLVNREPVRQPRRSRFSANNQTRRINPPFQTTICCVPKSPKSFVVKTNLLSSPRTWRANTSRLSEPSAARGTTLRPHPRHPDAFLFASDSPNYSLHPVWKQSRENNGENRRIADETWSVKGHGSQWTLGHSRQAIQSNVLLEVKIDQYGLECFYRPSSARRFFRHDASILP